MKYIRKVANARYVIAKRREFYDTECPLTDAQLEKLESIMETSNAVNDYLGQVYALLSQGANPANVEVPECLRVPAVADVVAELSREGHEQQQEQQDSDPTSSYESETSSTKRKSRTSTKSSS